jgi:glycosyltransferase involved in cell wall biosynthesis
MGGSELQAMNLSKHLISLGHEVNVLTFNTTGLPEFETSGGINIYRVSGKRLMIPAGLQFLQLRFPFLKRRVNKSFTEEYGKPNGMAELLLSLFFYQLCLNAIKKHHIKFSIIQLNTIEWLVITGALLSKKLTLPLLIRDSTVNGLAKLKSLPFGSKYAKWVIKNSLFIAISEMIKKNLIEQGVGEDRIFKIYNGVEIADKNSLEQNKTLNSCLFVGNLYQEPAKGFQILLQAWQRVIGSVDGVVLNVVGDGDIPTYEKLALSLGLGTTIKFWGKQSDTRRFYLTNEIFVLSSIREGMSNSLIEAMNYGLPCISTKVSGSTDLIINNESGLLIEPGNVNQLANAIIFLLNNKHLHKRFGLSAKERIKELCDIKVVSDLYSNVYKRLTSQFV